MYNKNTYAPTCCHLASSERCTDQDGVRYSSPFEEDCPFRGLESSGEDVGRLTLCLLGGCLSCSTPSRLNGCLSMLPSPDGNVTGYVGNRMSLFIEKVGLLAPLPPRRQRSSSVQVLYNGGPGRIGKASIRGITFPGMPIVYDAYGEMPTMSFVIALSGQLVLDRRHFSAMSIS